MSGPKTEHLDVLKADAASAPVVIFASRVTDVREILDRLDTLGLEHRVVTLAMRDPAQRERFHVLEEWTGSRILPQVFLDGHYIGGPKEFLVHPRLQGPAPAAGAWLGYAGLVPFALALAGLLVGGADSAAYFSLQFVAYGAVILSFVGAVHWGVALCGGPSPARRMIAAVLPALAGWAALLLPPAGGGWLLLAGFLALRAWETTRVGRFGLPEWYLRLRSRLTFGVAIMTFIFALAA